MGVTESDSKAGNYFVSEELRIPAETLITCRANLMTPHVKEKSHFVKLIHCFFHRDSFLIESNVSAPNSTEIEKDQIVLIVPRLRLVQIYCWLGRYYDGRGS